MDTVAEPHLLTVTEAAKLLCVERKKVFRLLKEDKVPFLRAGWVYLISDRDLGALAKLLGVPNGPSG